MSAKQEASKTEHKTKKFGKTERKIPHHTQKAKKFYPTEDEAKPRKVRDATGAVSFLPSVSFGWGYAYAEKNLNQHSWQHAAPTSTAHRTSPALYRTTTDAISHRSANQSMPPVPVKRSNRVASSSSSLAVSAASASSS